MYISALLYNYIGNKSTTNRRNICVADQETISLDPRQGCLGSRYGFIGSVVCGFHAANKFATESESGINNDSAAFLLYARYNLESMRMRLLKQLQGQKEFKILQSNEAEMKLSVCKIFLHKRKPHYRSNEASFITGSF